MKSNSIRGAGPERHKLNADCLAISNLTKTFILPDGRKIIALHRVNLSIKEGEFFGLVGESGSGKSTLAKCVLRLIEPDSGEINVSGLNWLALRGRELRSLRRKVQLIFQDPFTSLNPLFKVMDIVKEPLNIQGIGNQQEQIEKAAEALDLVRFPRDLVYRYPNQLSGGQRQRVAIARALVTKPALLIADEPVSSLDRNLQYQLTQLFSSLCKETGVTLLYITHDLNVVREYCSRIGVIRKGELLEVGKVEKIIKNPESEYTKQMVEAAFQNEDLKERN